MLASLKHSIEALAICLQANCVPILWGKAGIGKTATIEWIARCWGWTLEAQDISQMDPTDLGGIPQPVEDKFTRFLPPEWAYDLSQRSDPCLLFLDDATAGSSEMHQALMRVVHKRVVGSRCKLGNNVRIALAANPPTDFRVGADFSAAFANRLVHIAWPLDIIGWVQGMRTGWPKPHIPKLPDDWRERHLKSAIELVTAYGLAKRTDVHKQPTDQTQQGLAWPSLRSWTEMAAVLIAAARSVGASMEVEQLLIAGSVGDGVKAGFVEWQKHQDLPNPDELLADPTKIKAVVEGGNAQTILVCLSNLTAAVLGENTKRRWSTAIDILAYVFQKITAKDVPANFAKILWENQPPDLDKANLPKGVAAFREFLTQAGLL